MFYEINIQLFVIYSIFNILFLQGIIFLLIIRIIILPIVCWEENLHVISLRVKRKKRKNCVVVIVTAAETLPQYVCFIRLVQFNQIPEYHQVQIRNKDFLKIISKFSNFLQYCLLVFSNPHNQKQHPRV